jgi:hypothetical protein
VPTKSAHKMTKIEIENKNLKKEINELEVSLKICEQANEEFRITNKRLEDSVQTLLEINKLQKIDIDNPIEAIKKVHELMKGKSFTNITFFVKQIYAHVFKAMNEMVAKQKNDLGYNSRKLEELKQIGEDASNGEIFYEPR